MSESSSHRTPTFKDVLAEVSAHMSKQAGKHKPSNHVTKKTFAREIVNFLNTEYDLSPSVVISDFVGRAELGSADEGLHKTEKSKAQSQLAIATQRAAALFALEANLLQATFDELQKQIQLTKDAQQSSEYKFLPLYYAKEFIEPLERLKVDLQMKLEKARVKQVQAQQRFETLRQQATQPIMEQLQKSSRRYAKLYKSMDTATFCGAVNQLDIRLAVDGGVLRQAMNGGEAIGNHTVEYLRELYREAQDSRPLLHNTLRRLQKRCHDKGVAVEIEMGGLKAAERAIEKTVEEYEGDFSRLVDLVRGSVVCNSIEDATQVVRTLRELVSESATPQSPQQRAHKGNLCLLLRAPEQHEPLPALEILRVKNRLRPDFAAAAESGGYRDVLINVQINGGHVCELQVHLIGFLKVKAGGGHKTYTVARSLHLLDPELSQVRVSASNPEDTDVVDDKVRKELSDALKRVIAGTCQGLYLNHFKLTLAECRALKVALQAPACNVRDIALPNCGLDKQKSEVLCQGVEGNLGEFLTVNLFNNRGITGECVGLFISDELRSMSLRRCRLGPTDAPAISKALQTRKPCNMTEFNITGNDMGSEATQQLGNSLAGITLKSATNNVQVDEELQEMLTFALESKSLDAVAAICQQGARPFERIAYTQQSPFEFCASLDFDEGYDAMMQAYADPTLNLASLDVSKIPTRWKERMYEGLQQVFSSQNCCITRLVVTYYAAMTIDRFRIIQMMGRSALQLTDLDLRDNQLRIAGAKSIASSLGELKALTSLHLGSNALGTEGAKAIAPSLGELKALTSLLLYNNMIGSEGAKAIASSLGELKQLARLDLSSNELGAEGAKVIALSLSKLRTLTSLDLGYNQIKPEGARSIAFSLGEMKALTLLHLENNGLAAEGAKAIAPSLGELKALTSLNLERNELRAEGAKAIAPSLGELKKLSLLYLGDNGFKAQGAKAIAPSLGELKALTSLSLSVNEIGVEGAKAIAPSLNVLKALTSLALYDNRLRAEGAKAIVSALSELKTFTYLDLCKNELKAEGAKAIAPSLGELKALTSLDLGNNMIGASGAKAITPSLGELRALNSLSLNGNELRAEGAKAIALSLGELRALTSLELHENEIGIEGAKAIAPSLSELRALTSLNLSKNELGVEGAKAIAPSLSELRALKSLNLQDNNLSEMNDELRNQLNFVNYLRL